MPDGGEIGVALDRSSATLLPPDTHSNQEYVLMSVSDTGEGVAPELRDSLFEPFVTTKPDGTGLGLATSFRIVQESGGYLQLHDRGGPGAEFRVWLPAATTAAVAARESPESEPRPAVRSGAVLVVEDEHAVRSIALRILRNAGYEAEGVPDGHQAMHRLSRSTSPPDVLVTDVVLPGPSGPELAGLFKRRSPGGGVVFMSGYAADHFDRRPLTSDAAFLGKPFQAEELLDAVARVMRPPEDEGEESGWIARWSGRASRFLGTAV